jgi:2-dehydro-3-deoxygluconokinase
MRKCWGKRATVATALPQNDLGRLTLDLMWQGGVDASHLVWREFGGVGRNTPRAGLNFAEKGFGVRAALGCSDCGRSAASQIKPGEVNWEKLFDEHPRRSGQPLSATTASKLFSRFLSSLAPRSVSTASAC